VDRNTSSSSPVIPACSIAAEAESISDMRARFGQKALEREGRAGSPDAAADLENRGVPDPATDYG
jgi:hypothetical protein